MKGQLPRDDRQAAFRLIARLLEYPDQSWREAVPAFRATLGDLPAGKVAAGLACFLDEVARWDPYALCDHYVQTFDFSQATTLYLTYEQFGEQRERGQALLALKQVYERAGFGLDDRELPDYLPVVLEFASSAPAEEAEELLATFRPVIERIHGGLCRLRSPYRHVFSALLSAIGPVSKEAGGNRRCPRGVRFSG